MIVAKNNLLRKSVELSDYKDGKLGEFVKDLTGSNILLFSDLNPVLANHPTRQEQESESQPRLET